MITTFTSFPPARMVRWTALSAVLIFMSTGCASLSGPSRNAGDPSSIQPTRTQLLMLNRAESSGWVGYTDQAELNPPKEDYRVLVIRQATGDILYDSNVPLPANMKTHGFEMEPGDPRMQGLARRVDENIIAPMEAYKQRNENTATGSSLSPEEVPTAPVEENPEMAPSSTDADAPAPAPEAADGLPSLVEGPDSSLTGITVLETGTGTLVLDVEPADMLQKGDRIYLRRAPRVIVLPGMKDNILSPGEVAGLVEIRSVDEGTVSAKLLSGEIPAEMYFERAETP